jgi:hypothetical protein
MELHHETKARLTRPDGMPIDYVPNNHRKQPWNKVVRDQCIGVAPEKWGIDSIPSLAIIRKDGSREVVYHRSFRRKQSTAMRAAKVNVAAAYEKRVAQLGVDLSLASE